MLCNCHMIVVIGTHSFPPLFGEFSLHHNLVISYFTLHFIILSYFYTIALLPSHILHHNLFVLCTTLLPILYHAISLLSSLFYTTPLLSCVVLHHTLVILCCFTPHPCYPVLFYTTPLCYPLLHCTLVILRHPCYPMLFYTAPLCYLSYVPHFYLLLS